MRPDNDHNGPLSLVDSMPILKLDGRSPSDCARSDCAISSLYDFAFELRFCWVKHGEDTAYATL